MSPAAVSKQTAVRVPVYLVRGDDPSLVRDAVTRLVDSLVGEGDKGLLVEELAGDDYELAALVDAAQTLPFLTDRRVVVGRDVHRFTTNDSVAPLVAYLQNPLDTTDLVLVWETGRLPKPLTDVVKACGGERIDAGVGGTARLQKAWLSEQLAAAPVRLDSRAADLVASRLGEDVNRLSGLLAILASTHGEGAKLGEDDVAPYLGEAGSIAPWELTDSIDRGDVAGALARLHRTLGAGDRHPLQVMATLHGHYGRMLALDGASARTEREAAEVLGLKGSTFPARKAMDGARRLGSKRLAQVFRLLGQADLELRGARAWPDELVMEVLVARLANLNRAAAR
jgi:DNA polymerase-3 subunit delta